MSAHGRQGGLALELHLNPIRSWLQLLSVLLARHERGSSARRVISPVFTLRLDDGSRESRRSL